MVWSLLASDPPAASSLLRGKTTNCSSFLRLPTEPTHLFNSSAQLQALFHPQSG